LLILTPLGRIEARADKPVVYDGRLDLGPG
jgi:hypothetical protein